MVAIRPAADTRSRRYLVRLVRAALRRVPLPKRAYRCIEDHGDRPANAPLQRAICAPNMTRTQVHGEITMRPFAPAVLCLGLLLLAGIGDVEAHNQACAQNRNGGVACGAPDSTCIRDRRGEVICSTPGGGVVLDRLGVPMCGPGYCIRDQRGDAWCSSSPRGGAATDSNGRAHCTDSCVRGSNDVCVRPVPAR